MKLRWGVIGAGGIADRRTIPGMMEAENAELVAVMEVSRVWLIRLKKSMVPRLLMTMRMICLRAMILMLCTSLHL